MQQPSSHRRVGRPPYNNTAGHRSLFRSIPCTPEKQASFPSYQQDLSCPVCLQMPIFPVKTNCGHLFCALCLILYWKHGAWLDAISCPLCRQKVSMLCHLFGESQSDQQLQEVLVEINNYNKRYSGAPRRVMEYVGDAPLLLRHSLGSVGGLVLLFLFRVVLCCMGALLFCSNTYLDCTSSSVLSLQADAPLQANAPLFALLSTLDDLIVVMLLLICIFNINQQGEQNTRETAT